MQKFYHLVRDPVGIHVRPAGKFVKEALRYESKITLWCAGDRADGKSLFEILSLPAGRGDELCILVEGADERMAALELMDYLKDQT